MARLGGRAVAGFGPPGPLAAPAWITWVRVASAADAALAAHAAGGAVLAAGDGRALLADPAGAPFGVSENGGAALVNEPGSWDLSALSTTDPAGAERFYGALFGWEPEPFGRITLWRLPGYIGGIDGQPVPRDTVAIMRPGAGGARWGVDFRVDDADAAADRAVGLGAALLHPPHDVPGFRSAELADPQGAAFGVTQFLLE